MPSKYNVGVALGSLTAAVALLAAAPAASAQTTQGSNDTSAAGQAAPGGGSFPGSFLVPGTSTSIKIGGFAKLVGIYDLGGNAGQGAAPDKLVPASVALNGSAAHALGQNFRLQARQSNVSFDARTPTSYGELETFIFIDFFGQNTSNTFANSNTQNARLVLAYGTLGPLLGGQALSLWFDGDALGETVDPQASVGINNGLTNRQPQIRYTYAGAGGISFAGSIEQPNFEGFDNSVATPINASGALTSAQKYPDIIAKGRWDQAWGHVALAGLLKDNDVNEVTAAAAPFTKIHTSRVGWGVNLTGHLNTFGKDTLRGGFMVGEGLGRYLSDMGIIAGLQTNLLGVGGATPGVKSPLSYGGNLSYTHWWTDSLRATAMGGYSHVDPQTSTVITTAAAQNNLDKDHIGATANLVWSPVSQVDLGIEYTYIQRVVAGPNPALGIASNGHLHTIEAETVFKF